MGFFDTVKEKAGAFATDAERAGRVTAAQTRLLVLQNDLRKAERDLGHAAAALIEGGVALHPDLAPAAARVHEVREALRAKEAEIAALRATGAADATAADRPAPAPEGPAPAVEPPAAKEAESGAAPATAPKPPAKPAAKRATAGKHTTKKPAAKKTPAKKAVGGAKQDDRKPAPRKPPTKKPAAGKPPASTE